MDSTTADEIAAIIEAFADDLLADWLAHRSRASGWETLPEGERRRQAERLHTVVARSLRATGSTDVGGPGWEEAREVVGDLAAAWAEQGFSPRETAGFVISFGRGLMDRLPAERAAEGGAVELVREIARLAEDLALLTVDVHLRRAEAMISRQGHELTELSTPVVKLWEGVLAVPLIGTLDSSRAEVVLESLLQRIVDTGSEIAIVDITGVPTVDTQVAQHLLKTVAAARLMGADCILSGLRPQIAQTIVHLGLSLEGVITKATMADAIEVALARVGYAVTRARPG